MPHAEPSIQLAVGDVSILALVQIEHPVDRESLKMADEVGRHHRDETPLCHDPCLDVIELQAAVDASHLTCGTKHAA